MKKLSRKILSVLLVIAMLVPTGSMMVTSFAAEAITYYDGVWAYQIVDGYAMLVGVSEVQNGDVCGPPSYLGGYPLKVIDGINCGALAGIRTTQFIIPQGVEQITQSAFNTGLFTSIVIPLSLKSVGFNSFPNCYNFTTVYYEGTEEDWSKISISYPGLSNKPLINATRYYNYKYPVDASEKFEFNGNQYQLFNESLSWTDAKTACEKLGGHLLTITSQAEQEFITEKFLTDKPQKRFYYLGGYRDNEISAWKWITDENFRFFNWQEGEAEQTISGQNYMMMSSSAETTVSTSKWLSHFNSLFNENYWSTYNIGYICEWDSEGDVPRDYFPEGYDFKEDSYNFKNGTTTISKKYFTTLYGEEQGKLLYKKKKNAGGVCFGMAYTTAAFYQGLPSLTTNVRDLGTKTTIRIGNNYMSVYDYIVYSYIYQWSTACWPKYNDYMNINELYKIVTTHISNNVLVPITIWNLKETSPGNYDTAGAHTVLAVGFDENSIIVDDPNNKSGMERIKLTGGEEWEYSLPWEEGGIHSNNAALACSLDVHIPYTLLRTGKTTTVHEDVLSSNTRDSLSSNIRTETYVEGMDKLDADQLLMFVDSESHKIDSENLIEITDTIGTDESEANDIGNLYWVSKDKTVTVSDITGEDNEIIIAGNEVSIGVKTQDNSVVTMTVDEENDDISAEIDSTVGNEYTVTFESSDENENDLITTITGTANGDEVTATETEDGIQVTGLNDITVTYETVDGTAETKADVKDGSTVNITVNDDENKVETDWQDKQPDSDETDSPCKHPDTDHNGICDNCAEDFTKGCSCNCHGNAFMQFLHKIISFLRKLFGMNQYQFCDCGKAHW